MFRKNCLIPLICLWMSSLPVCAANVASILFKGTEGVVELTQRIGNPGGVRRPFWDYFSRSRRRERRDALKLRNMIVDNRDRLLEALGLPTDTTGQKFLDGMAFWNVEPADIDMLSRASEFLRQDLDKIEGGAVSAMEFLDSMSDLSRIAYRAGRTASGRRYSIFPYPVYYAYSGGPFAEFVMLRRLDHPRIGEIAAELPLKRADLVAMAKYELPLLGFKTPLDSELDGVSEEKLAAWMLVVGVLRHGDREMQRVAEAVFEAMRSGSRNFFVEGNDSMAYGMFFKWTTFGESKIGGIVDALSSVAQMRRDNPQMTMTGALFSVRTGSAPPGQ